MNTQLITDKIHDIVALLNTVNVEAKEIEAKRLALENAGYANSEREKKIYAREVAQNQKDADIEAQKKSLDEQNHNTQLVLHKIMVEKEGLKDLVNQKRDIEQERLQLEADKKGFETMKQEKDDFIRERAEFEKERQLFSKEKLAMMESQKLLSMREANIAVKEERLDKIERMTAV